MATTDNASQLQKDSALKLLEIFGSYLPSGKDLVSSLVDSGIIDIGRLNEVIDANQLEIALDSQEGHDLSDGSDCKFATVTEVSSSPGSFSASVCSKNSTGNLRVRIYHPGTSKWWYGVIPHELISERTGLAVSYSEKKGQLSGQWAAFFREGWEPFSEPLVSCFQTPVLVSSPYTDSRGYARSCITISRIHTGKKVILHYKGGNLDRKWEGLLPEEAFKGKKAVGLHFRKNGEPGGRWGEVFKEV